MSDRFPEPPLSKRVSPDSSPSPLASCFSGREITPKDIFSRHLSSSCRAFAGRGLLLLLASLTFLLSAGARDADGFAKVLWNPQQLESGSVCLFTVEAPTATSVAGKWMGHNLVFAQASGKPLWYAAAGVDVETKAGTYPLQLEAALPQGKTITTTRNLQILPAQYKTVKLHVATRFVEPDEETRKIIEADKAIKKQVFGRESAAPGWSGDFEAPVNSTISETFGTRRTFNGKLASIHRGVDYRAASGTPVLAANSGEVVLAQALFYEGNCVIIDHGQGFMTLYMHLSKFMVTVGDKVTKGEQVGLSGATGRVTGPHLHMAARWENAYVDPLKLLTLPLPVLQ